MVGHRKEGLHRFIFSMVGPHVSCVKNWLMNDADERQRENLGKASSDTQRPSVNGGKY
jgi:hypothetical protein